MQMGENICLILAIEFSVNRLHNLFSALDQRIEGLPTPYFQLITSEPGLQLCVMNHLSYGSKVYMY